MRRLPSLMATNGENRPAWFTELIKALILVALGWGVTAWLNSRGDNEHRFSVLETKTEIMQNDIKEIKTDVKEVLKNVK